MNFKLLNLSLILTFLLIYPLKLQAEFKKEIKLTDEGKCEEALIENNNTSIEQEKTFNPKKPFVGKNTLNIFRLYALNRKVQILKNNCKKNEVIFSIEIDDC